MTDIDVERAALLSVPRKIDWKPYLAGAGIGVLSWIVFVVVANPIGITTAMSQVAGAIASVFLGADAVAANSYWKTHVPRIDYGVIFLLGVLLGAFASAAASGTFRIEKIPALWRGRFGESTPLRMGAAFTGGAILMFGARLAGGCTSGNGISQGLQLALVGWTFLAVMFPAGMLAAWLLFRPRR